MQCGFLISSPTIISVSFLSNGVNFSNSLGGPNPKRGEHLLGKAIPYRYCQMNSGISWNVRCELCKFCNLTTIPYMYWRQYVSVGLIERWYSLLWSPICSLIIHELDARMSFRASSGIVNRKRGKRYVEPYKEIDMFGTKNSDKVAFACIVKTDKCWKVMTGQSR